MCIYPILDDLAHRAITKSNHYVDANILLSSERSRHHRTPTSKLKR